MAFAVFFSITYCSSKSKTPGISIVGVRPHPISYLKKPDADKYWQQPITWELGSLNRKSVKLYPVQERPRLLRFEMYLALKDYLKNGNEERLAHFSHWFNEWRKHFKYEFENSSDRDVGTLVYIEKMKPWLKENQNNKAVDFSNKLISKLLDTDVEDKLKQNFSLQYEADYLGSLAEFCLTRYTKKTDWQLAVNKGSSPLSLLAKQVKPKKTKANRSRKSEFLNLAVRKMYRIDTEGQLDRAVSGIVQTKVVKLVIPKSKLKLPDRLAGQTYKSFFNYKNAKDVDLHLFRSEFRLQGEKNHHDFKEGDVLVSAQKTPCGEEASVILIYDRAPVKVEWPAKPSKRTNWLCAK